MKKENSIVKNKYRLIFQYFILIITLSVFTTLPPKCHAADFELSIYPPLLRVNIKPGKSITQVFKIDNSSTDTQTLVARLVPFISADPYGNPKIDPSLQVKWLNYFTLANSTIQLNQPFEIKAGSSEQLILSLAVPDTAPLKDIYATLLVSTYSNNIDTNFQGSNLRASIASNLLITVSSQLAPATILKVSEFSPEAGSYLQIGNFYLIDNITPLTFYATAKNEGDFTAETKGVFRIQRNEKNPVQLQSILPQYVIAKSERKLINADDQDFKFTPSIGMIGLYQAQIEIHTDNANTINQIDIIFLPIKALFAFAVGLSLLLIVVNIAFRPTQPE